MPKYLSALIVLFLLFYSVNAQNYNKLVEQANADRKTGANISAAATYNKAGYLAWDEKNLDDAIAAFQNSLELNKIIGNANAVKIMYGYLGELYIEKEQFDQALEYFNKGLTYTEVNNDIQGKASFIKKIGDLYYEKGDFHSAVNQLEKALSLANSINDENTIRNAHRSLSEAYKALGQTEKSFEHFGIYRALLTKLQREQTKRIEEEAAKKVTTITKEKTQLEQEKELVELQKLQTEFNLNRAKDSLEKASTLAKLQEEHISKLQVEKELDQLKDENAKLILELVVLALVFIVGIAIYVIVVLRRTRQKNELLKKQKQEIESNQKEIEEKSEALQGAFSEIKEKSLKIESSINYAQRIQSSMLPDQSRLTEFFDDAFVFFKPKDIVSGDFYWFDHPKMQGTMAEDTDKLVITAADCTGHGVPGALMSMIGYNTLHNINTEGISEPASILNELHRRIRYNLLKQHITNNKDGMDMSLCLIDRPNKTIHYAGANNPLVYIQNEEVHVIKADRKPIGGLQKEDERIFTTHSISFDTPTYCYLFSDGFQDQFGGEEGRKFMIKRLRNLFLEHHQKPFTEQKEILESTLNTWMNDHDKVQKQIDDILIIGFRVG